MPLTRRVPTRGFVNIFRKEYEVVNVGRLAGFGGESVVTPQLLREKGVIHGGESRVKILGDGELKAPLTVQAHAFSKRALEKISSVGGKAEVIEGA
jgi:large subunit ribosomal protein L15